MLSDYFNLMVFQFFFGIFRAMKETNTNIQYVMHTTYKQISIGYKSYAISLTTYIYITINNIYIYIYIIQYYECIIVDCRCSMSNRGYINIFISVTSVFNEYNGDMLNVDWFNKNVR